MKNEQQGITNAWTLAVVAMALLAVDTNAAEITYAGFQTGIETMSATETNPPAGWRNPVPVKPLDLDGDNILGTDGYIVDGHTLKPSYFSSWARVSQNDNGWDKFIDSPADPTGNDTVRDRRWRKGRVSDSGYYTFTITGDYLDRNFLLIGMLIPGGSVTGIHTLKQTNGTAQASQSVSVTAINDSLAAIFWVIKGAKDGDVFLISNPEERSNCGLFVDSAPLPPSGTVITIK